MTPARLARKRKADRESQRASRLKQKTYVAHLEAMVKSLDAPEGTDPVELVKQQGAENIEIKKALSAICKIAQTALGTGGRPSLATSSSPDATTDTGDGQYMNVEPYKCEKTQTAKVSPSMNDFDVETIACMGRADTSSPAQMLTRMQPTFLPYSRTTMQICKTSFRTIFSTLQCKDRSTSRLSIRQHASVTEMQPSWMSHRLSHGIVARSLSIQAITPTQEIGTGHSL